MPSLGAFPGTLSNLATEPLLARAFLHPYTFLQTPSVHSIACPLPLCFQLISHFNSSIPLTAPLLVWTSFRRILNTAPGKGPPIPPSICASHTVRVFPSGHHAVRSDTRKMSRKSAACRPAWFYSASPTIATTRSVHQWMLLCATSPPSELLVFWFYFISLLTTACFFNIQSLFTDWLQFNSRDIWMSIPRSGVDISNCTQYPPRKRILCWQQFRVKTLIPC